MRLGRLGHDPMARPAPITLGWVPRPRADADEKAIQPRKAAAAPVTVVPRPVKVATVSTPAPQPKPKPAPVRLRNGNTKATTIAADWREVVLRLREAGQSHRLIGAACNCNQSMLSHIVSGRSKPGPKLAEALVAMWAKHIGGPLP